MDPKDTKEIQRDTKRLKKFDVSVESLLGQSTKHRPRKGVLENGVQKLMAPNLVGGSKMAKDLI